MPNIIFPKGNILAKKGKPAEEIHVNQKIKFNIEKKYPAFLFFSLVIFVPWY